MEVLSAFFPVILILFISSSSIQTWCFMYPSQNDCLFPFGNGDCVQISFPFRLSDQSESCGYPGFELYYQHEGEGESVMLNLQSLQPFRVFDIDYDWQLLFVSDPGGCLFTRLLNLSLLSSPFRLLNSTNHNRYQLRCYGNRAFYQAQYYRYRTDDNFYKPVNCSLNASSYGYSFVEVPCARHLPGYYYWATDSLSPEVLAQFQCKVLTDEKFFITTNFYRPQQQILILIWDQPNRRHYHGGCRLNMTSKDSECYAQTPNYPPSFILDQNFGKASRVRNLIIGEFLPLRSLLFDLHACTNKYLNSKSLIHLFNFTPAGLVISITFVVVAIIYIVLITHRMSISKMKDKKNLKIENFLKEYKHMKPTRYSYSQLKKMADNFKVKLGQGAHGSVFEGKLPNGLPMAVKVLDNQTLSGEEFTNEIDTIGRIHHINIVRLLGFCVEGSARALIYEFMPNESLEKYIAMEEGKNVSVFSWTKLHEISMGIALGMEYLHQGCDQRILHLDIKPQNILLDQEFNPKISDFGLAKLCSKERSLVSMTAVRGTVGYIAPEVFLGSNSTVSHKSDVYSFGILLLEMIGGRRKMDESDESSRQIYFPEWIYQQLKQGGELGLVTDTDEDVEIAKKLTKIALWCAQWRPVERPSMKLVVQMLGASQENLPMPPNPFASCLEEKILDCIDIVEE
ncbi:rust resistance kinase Lr10-like isoform X2 [Zingiber officinale]|uniref:rust resistance kinase Lr10-like isoform X2 n=1 Tax=Zingiber officinale TaxID=94328 RepID=UPI001C4C30C2|nr:rust resistance kinase Lr10-like isoform X2 [Zingiber officinale]